MQAKNAKWHHRIAHFPDIQLDGWIPNRKKHTDFCSYTRWFLWKLLVVIPLTCVILGSLLGWYFAGWLNLFFAPWVSFSYFSSQDVNILWCFLHALVIFILCLWLSHLAGTHLKGKFKKSTKVTKEKEPSFLKLWYLKIKHKYCPKMDY